jgi:hypothetical protein
VLQTIENALNEMERIDFLWGKIRIEKLTVSPVIKADIRMEVDAYLLHLFLSHDLNILLL